MNKSRLEAFSDGVFAIVITLLILDIRIPDVKYEHLAEAIGTIIPHIIAYVMSFLVIGLYWIFHHNTAQLVQKVDRPFIWLNIVFLLFVSFMPFPTTLMGKYPFTQIPVLIYGANLLLANITGWIITVYTYKRDHLKTESFTPAIFKRQMKVYAIVNGLYVIALVITFVNPTISYIVFIGVFALLIMTTKSNKHGV